MANWPNDKHIICNVNNDIPVKIPSHPYVLVNRSVLCKCDIEADSHHLLESLAACDSKQLKLIMYFTINLAFSSYLELIPNMTEHKTLNRDKTLREQRLPIYINISCYDTTLSDRSTKLFTTTYAIMMTKKFLICKEGILDIHFHLTKISFLTK